MAAKEAIHFPLSVQRHPKRNFRPESSLVFCVIFSSASNTDNSLVHLDSYRTRFGFWGRGGTLLAGRHQRDDRGGDLTDGNSSHLKEVRVPVKNQRDRGA